MTTTTLIVFAAFLAGIVVTLVVVAFASHMTYVPHEPQPAPAPAQPDIVVDLTVADLDRLDAQLAHILQHFPCRPDQRCDLHDPGVCAVTRRCPSCTTNPAPATR